MSILQRGSCPKSDDLLDRPTGITKVILASSEA